MKRFPRIASCVLCLALMCGTAGLPAVAASFSDAEGHWAQQALTDAADNGLLQGADGKLMPNGLLTRAELAAIMVRAVQAVATADLSQASDVPAGAWYASDIAKAVQMEILQGSGGMLRPIDPITRQETFTVLARALALTDGDASSLSRFADSSAIAGWARNSVAALVDAGLVVGGDAGLRPQDTITRAEFVTVMQRAVDCYIMAKDGTVITEVSGTNVMLTGQNLRLKNVVIEGDLYLGDGVNASTVTLENVTVKGRLVMRGGLTLTIAGASSISGDTVLLRSDAALDVAKGSSLGQVIVSGSKVKLTGSGKVTAVDIKGNSCSVSIPGAVVTVVSGVTGTLAGTVAVPGGGTVTVPQGSTSVGSSGGSSSQQPRFKNWSDAVKDSTIPEEVRLYIRVVRDGEYHGPYYTARPSVIPVGDGVNTSFFSADRNLWLGTDQGILVLSSNNVSKTFTTDDGLPYGRVVMMFYDGKTGAWVLCGNPENDSANAVFHLLSVD